jgi:hypothetical protein
VDGTGSGLCPMTGFGISSLEPSGFSTAVSVSKMNVRETGCENER